MNTGLMVDMIRSLAKRDDAIEELDAWKREQREKAASIASANTIGEMIEILRRHPRVHRGVYFCLDD